MAKYSCPRIKFSYELFEQVAETVEEMGVVLKKLVSEPDINKRLPLAKQIEDLEHRNDDHTHKIFTELGRNFITPFDREDIHYLATSLDDIADLIYTPHPKSLISIKLTLMIAVSRKWPI